MKRSIKALLLTMLMIVAMSTTALAAEEEPKAGLYLTGSDTNVTIVMQDANGAAVGADQDDASYYPDAVRMQVTYTGDATVDDQFVVLLMEGSNPVPTASNPICYINQVAKEADKSVTFDVYPMLSGSTPMTLYITSNRAEFETIDISMNYVAPYKLGDVTGDGQIFAEDAMAALKISVGLGSWTDTQKLAADVNSDGDVFAGDAMNILKKSVGLAAGF